MGFFASEPALMNSEQHQPNNTDNQQHNSLGRIPVENDSSHGKGSQ